MHGTDCGLSVVKLHAGTGNGARAVSPLAVAPGSINKSGAAGGTATKLRFPLRTSTAQPGGGGSRSASGWSANGHRVVASSSETGQIQMMMMPTPDPDDGAFLLSSRPVDSPLLSKLPGC